MAIRFRTEVPNRISSVAAFLRHKPLKLASAWVRPFERHGLPLSDQHFHTRLMPAKPGMAWGRVYLAIRPRFSWSSAGGEELLF
jgi:hypothetical protein